MPPITEPSTPGDEAAPLITDPSVNNDAEEGPAKAEVVISLEYVDSIRDELGSQIEEMKAQLNKQGLNSNVIEEEIDSQKITPIPTETDKGQMSVIVLVPFGAILLILLLLICFLCYKLSASKQ